jgi:outer membrane lipoprotein-sorting protein
LRIRPAAGWITAACVAAWVAATTTLAASAQAPAAPARPTAAEIVEKNAAARGGVDAWRRINTMAWSGHVESASSPARAMPFLLEQQRPNRMRFEIMAQNQRSVRVFDGTSGWKMHPNKAGRPEAQDYSADELRFARDAQVIGGPLMEAASRGAEITLGGVAEVEGHEAYALDIKLPDGANFHVWVDVASFLEVRYDREFRNARDLPAVASVFYRDYHAFEGLQIPLVIETGTAAANQAARDRLVIDRVALNPAFDDRMFARPGAAAGKRKRVTVDTRTASAASPSAPAP